MKTIIKLIIIILFAFIVVSNNCQADEIDDLLQRFAKSEHSPDNYALNKLIEIGRPAINPTLEQLKNENEAWPQQQYLSLLTFIGNETISDEILPFTSSPEGNVREWAIFFLGRFGNKKSIEALINSLEDQAVESGAKVQAVSRLQYLTGQKINLTSNMSPQEQRSAAQKWMNWLKTQK